MRRTVLLICLCALALSLTGCKKARLRSQVKTLMESTITLPEKVTCVDNGHAYPMPDSLRSKAKLIVYVDTTECTTCRITHLGRYVKLFDLSREKGSFDVVLLLANVNLYGVPVIRYLSDLGMACAIYVDEDNAFLGQNPSVPEDPRLHAFFVDEAGTPLCIGDPSASENLFQVFLRALDKLPTIDHS
ncbi:hypothetical protein SAMN06298214_1547 [Bacteroidales bacterium WCE2004]|nr:hypothetical protein SAMN06298214_1547 [Bacteroidales bacterium WCE2004]